MRNWFEMEYNETEETLTDMHDLYLTKQSAYTYKMVLLLFGTFIFFLFLNGDNGQNF